MVRSIVCKFAILFLMIGCDGVLKVNSKGKTDREPVQCTKEDANCHMDSTPKEIEKVVPEESPKSNPPVKTQWTFLDYCKNQNSGNDIKHTIQVLKEMVDKEDCDEAYSSLTDETKIYFFGNSDLDLSPLQGLNNLKYISINDCHRTDLSTLPQLPNLQSISLHGTKIENISSLEKFENLKDLEIRINESFDISFLKNLNKLRSLSISQNPKADISAIKSLSNLTTLDLSENQITDISAIKSLSNLTTLDLSENQITDISAIKSLSNLTTLDLSENQITDISPIQSLSKLGSLILYGNPITDFSSLEALEKLNILEVSRDDVPNDSFLYLTERDFCKDRPKLVSRNELSIIHYKDFTIEGRYSSVVTDGNATGNSSMFSLFFDLDPREDRWFNWQFDLISKEDTVDLLDITPGTEEIYQLSNLPEGVRFQIHGSSGYSEENEASSSAWLDSVDAKYSGLAKISILEDKTPEMEICIFTKDLKVYISKTKLTKEDP